MESGVFVRGLGRRGLLVTAQIGLGFLWSGAAYMMQAYRLMAFYDPATVNLLVCGLYYILQAAGIGAFALLLARRPAVAGGRMLPLCASLAAVACTVASVLSPVGAAAVAGGALLNLLIGALSACYLTRLATDISQRRRGLVFGVAYALGSVGTWLLSLPGGGRFLWDMRSLFAVAALAALSLPLLKLLPPIPGKGQAHRPARSGPDRRLLWLAGAVLFLLSAENMLGFSFPLKAAEGSVHIEFTRAFYAVGLVAAGLISDKNRRWGAMSCLAALAFPFAALALGNTAVGETAMWMLAYLFLGFWSAYRILVFSDISGNAGLPALAVLGLMAGRLGEAAGTLCAGIFSGAALVVFSGAVFALVIALFFPLYQKLYTSSVPPEEAERQRLETYGARFRFSAREREVFSLIVRGMSNVEIAAALYITESTVKFHTGNIFKKTGHTNRSELTADFQRGLY